MLQVRVQLRCREHEQRDPACAACRKLAYFERRYDSVLTQRGAADGGDPHRPGQARADHRRPEMRGVPQGVLQAPL